MPIADPDPVPDGPTTPAKPVAPDGPPESAERPIADSPDATPEPAEPDPTEQSLTRSVLDDLRSFAQADAAQLDDLASLLDDLRQRAGTFADDGFDADRIWARVEREVFG